MVLLVRLGLGPSWGRKAVDRSFSSNQLCSFGLGLFLGKYDKLSNGLVTAMSWSLCSRKPITVFSGHQAAIHTKEVATCTVRLYKINYDWTRHSLQDLSSPARLQLYQD
jgi:hypothetical protein